MDGFPNAWSPDGSELVFLHNGDIWMLPRDGKAEPRPIVSAPGLDGHAAFSGDGRWLAYASGFGGASVPGQHVYVQPYPSLDSREQISIENGFGPAWRHDGRELYYTEDASADGPLKIRMMAVPITTTPAFSAGTPRMLFEGAFRVDGPFRGYDVAPDGQRFVMVQEVPRPPVHVSHMVLVQNWTEELKRIVPAR